MNLIFTCGGTAGHINPAIAVANIDKVIEKLSNVERQEDSIRPINFVAKKLMELRDLIKDALTINFKSKSYMENQTLLMRFMGNYTTLTKIIEELDKSKSAKQ